MTKLASVFAAILLLLLSSVSHAEIVEFEFRGVVTQSLSDTLDLRGPHGEEVEWTGPLPDYPYQIGDEITISFDVRVQPDYFHNPAHPLYSEDGIYRFGIVGASPDQHFNGAAVSSNFEVTGGTHATGQILNGLFLRHDLNTGEYLLEIAPDGYVGAHIYAPALVQDSLTGAFQTVSSFSQIFSNIDGQACGGAGYGCAAWRGDLGSGIFDQVPVIDDEGARLGFFDILFSGDWFLNGDRQAGGATQVPEPGMLLLFGLALGALFWRRGLRKPKSQVSG